MSDLQNQMDSFDEPEERKKSIEEKFEDRRVYLKNFIVSLAEEFRGEIEKLAETQTKIFSERQRILEEMYGLISKHSKFKKKKSLQWKEEYKKLSEESDFRYGEKEKLKLIDEKLATITDVMDQIEAQIDYLKESVKTVDNMVFGVKHRIDIEDFKRGNR